MKFLTRLLANFRKLELIRVHMYLDDRTPIYLCKDKYGNTWYAPSSRSFFRMNHKELTSP